MEHVQRNNLSLFGAYDNAEYGVVSVRSTDNRIEYGGVWGNKKAGLYLADRSNNNFVFRGLCSLFPLYGRLGERLRRAELWLLMWSAAARATHL